MVTIQATIFYERRFWIGLFERIDEEGYAVARHIFGAEPTDPEVYQFVLEHYVDLKFGEPREFDLQIKRMNPKRLQREVRKEMRRMKEDYPPSSYAQDVLREELEQNKKEKSKRRSQLRKEKEDEQFELRQRKKKERHKGH